MMSVLCSRNQLQIMFCKGAPESIISRCTNILCNDDGSTIPLTANIRAELESRFHRWENPSFLPFEFLLHDWLWMWAFWNLFRCLVNSVHLTLILNLLKWGGPSESKSSSLFYLLRYSLSNMLRFMHCSKYQCPVVHTFCSTRISDGTKS